MFNEHWKKAEYHVQWDLLKLNDKRNRVKHGYILFFVRNYPYDRVNKNHNYFIDGLRERFGNESKTHIIYVEKYYNKQIFGLISNTSFKDYIKL